MITIDIGKRITLLYIKGAVMMTFAVRIMDIYIVVQLLNPGIFGMWVNNLISAPL